MKKRSLFVICLFSLTNILCQSHEKTPYISELFEKILTKSIQLNLDKKARNNIYATNKHELYVININGFDNPEQKGIADILKLNVITGAEENHQILPPPKFAKTVKNTAPIWIWSIAASDSLLYIAVDEGIWVYRLTKKIQYEYIRTIALKDVFRLEMDENNLHAFIEKEDGFDWYKINFTNEEIKKVRKLELKNRFFLQIAPIQIISIKNNALYFLQQNEPSIEKYSLTGELLAHYHLKIPNWNNIPKEITKKLDSLTEVERVYSFSKFSVFDYNFAYLFFVFPSERFFLTAKDADVHSSPFFIQIIGDTAIVEPYSNKLAENEKFGEKYFPFIIPRADENIINANSTENITQINCRTNVSWNNKTQKEFQKEVNLYYRDNEPIEQIETYRIQKNYIPVDSVRFLDYDSEIFSLNDVKKEKAIFIVSQYPQCSACIKTIWQYFSKKLLPNTELYCALEGGSTYLIKKEKIKEVNTYLNAEYIPLFFDTKTLNPATKRLLAQKSNPIVILFDKKLQHVEVISGNHIVADLTGNLKTSFLNTIDNFIGK